MKTDALSMTLLFDFYGDLLTDKQKTYFDLYYNQDLSLAEIAENEGVSRQGVYDALKRTERTLRELEDVTGCVAKALERAKVAAELRKIAADVARLPNGSPLSDAIESVCGRLEDEHGI
ncbi:MAG: YlxM family DNA-binding protein [Oscillospiraceae bacterium]|nr:YlxM family DNA-binding protein [Oscillospiraceae bacterium]